MSAPAFAQTTPASDWIEPAATAAASTPFGHWAITTRREARFSFAIPEDFDTLDTALIVVIGEDSGDSTVTIEIAVSEDNQQADVTSASGSLTRPLASGRLNEFDLSDVFTDSALTLQSGQYVSMVVGNS